MTLTQELSSWLSPTPIETAPPPQIGDKAPSDPKLQLPPENGNPTIVAFLRHCGCPVAEATLFNLRTAATQHPHINFIAVSHSSEAATQKWLHALGGADKVTVLVDAERRIYAKWGLGVVGWRHVLSFGGLIGVWRLGKERGIWNRPTESGSRWQGAGCWAVDGEGVVRWGGVARRVDEMVDVGDVVRGLG